MSDLERRARLFATNAHAGQRYGDSPYEWHLADVAEALIRFGHSDPEMLAAAWLHDVMEDGGVSRERPAAEFGERVADLVWAITNEPGANRKERHAATYPKIRATPGAVALKLADRIANVEAGGKLVRVYRKEHRAFRAALYTAGECEPMWDHLDALLARPKENERN